MHDPRLSYIYMRKDSLRLCMHEAAAQHRTPLISPISLQSKTKLGFNIVKLLWYGSSWPGSQSERWKSNLEWKKNSFILSNYNELVDILSSGMETPWKGLLQTMFAEQVSLGAMRHANNLKIYLALISSAWILNICRLSNGPFLNLGATCFRTEWRARANFRRLLLRD